MSIVKALICNGCGTVGPRERESFYPSARWLRTQAAGWMVDGNKDWCPACGWRGEKSVPAVVGGDTE